MFLIEAGNNLPVYVNNGKGRLVKHIFKNIFLPLPRKENCNYSLCPAPPCGSRQAPPRGFTPRGNICAKGLLPEASVSLQSREWRCCSQVVGTLLTVTPPRTDLPVPLVSPRGPLGFWPPDWVGQARGRPPPAGWGGQGLEGVGNPVLPSLVSLWVGTFPRASHGHLARGGLTSPVLAGSHRVAGHLGSGAEQQGTPFGALRGEPSRKHVLRGSPFVDRPCFSTCSVPGCCRVLLTPESPGHCLGPGELIVPIAQVSRPRLRTERSLPGSLGGRDLWVTGQADEQAPCLPLPGE